MKIFTPVITLDPAAVRVHRHARSAPTQGIFPCVKSGAPLDTGLMAY